MLTTAPLVYGVVDPAEARLMSGREFLEAIMDGRLPAPPMARTLSFLLTEVGDGFAVFEGDAGEHLLNPLGVVHGGWALTLIDSATGCAGQTHPARRRELYDDRDQGQFLPPDHQGYGAGSGRGARHRARPADPFLRGADRRRQGAYSRPWHIDADGVGGRRSRPDCVGSQRPAYAFFSHIFLRESRIHAILAGSPTE